MVLIAFQLSYTHLRRRSDAGQNFKCDVCQRLHGAHFQTVFWLIDIFVASEQLLLFIASNLSVSTMIKLSLCVGHKNWGKKSTYAKETTNYHSVWQLRIMQEIHSKTKSSGILRFIQTQLYIFDENKNRIVHKI